MKKLLLLCSILYTVSGIAQQPTFNLNALILSTGSDAEFAGIGDLNGDGLNDVAAVTTSYFDTANDYRIFIWLQKATGALQLQPMKFRYNPLYANAFTVSDVNKDGVSEMILCTGGLVCIYNLVSNNLVLKDSIRTYGSIQQDGVVTADFDNDGLTDIGVSHWNGDRISVLFGTSSGWDVRHYNIPTGGYGDVTAGKFGSLNDVALVYTNGQSGSSSTGPPVIVLTFDSNRAIKNRYDLGIPGSGYPDARSAAIVKRPGGSRELWITRGGNRPDSKVAIWRDVHTLPDTLIKTYDIPDAIKSANLDCDDDDEPVVVHSGWDRVTVFADTQIANHAFTNAHCNPDGLALGDINNDGRKDICIANGLTPGNVWILYNITLPCWPASVNNVTNTPIEIDVYPNPSNGTFTVSLSNGYTQATVTVFDITGRMVISKQMSTANETITIGNAAKSVYNVRVITDNTVINKRIAIE